MKLAVILATRGNPRRAAAVIEVAKATASGDHALEFMVACDEDDTETVEHFSNYPDVRTSVAPRPPGVAQCWNRCVPLVEADVYLLFTDDAFPATPLWDQAIALYVEEGRYPRTLAAFAWHDTANPGQPTLLGASREWLDLIGPFIDDRFPFWFADTAFAETWSFVTGKFLPILPITMASRPGRFNPRLRDMGFWWDFYVETRTERLVLARDIRKTLDLPVINLGEVLKAWIARDVLGRPGAIEIAEALPKVDPSPEYWAAYEVARVYMTKQVAE